MPSTSTVAYRVTDAIIVSGREDADDVDPLVGKEGADVLEQTNPVPCLDLNRDRERLFTGIAPGYRDQSLRFRGVEDVRAISAVHRDPAPSRDETDDGISIHGSTARRQVGEEITDTHDLQPRRRPRYLDIICRRKDLLLPVLSKPHRDTLR